MSKRAALPEPVICSEFWCNRQGESIRVQLREFEGVLLVDVRKHFSAPDGTLQPTSKGVSLSVRKLPELTVAIGKALLKARELGLIGGKS